MNFLISRFDRLLYALLLLGGIACTFPAQAASYEFTTIAYPGTEAGFNQVFGINNAGKIVGNAAVDWESPSISFVYDARTKAFTALPTYPGRNTGVLGINEAGVIAGGATEDLEDGPPTSGIILNRGEFNFFSHPGSVEMQARAISNTGLVTGYAKVDELTYVGFIYDPKDDSFIDFLPSPQTIAQGINDKGDVVGSVWLNDDDAYSGSPGGYYGFLRDGSGAFTYFRVNNRPTKARGITQSGTIVGFVRDDDGYFVGFVTSLAPTPGFQSPSIDDDDLLRVPITGEVETYLEAIDESGRIVGEYIVYGEAPNRIYSFLATPLPKGKKK